MTHMSASASASCPSFSSYSSSETLAQIAARVIHELRIHDDTTLFDSWDQQNDDDDDFEFALVSRDPNSSPVSADDIFYNGQIRPTYPLFDRNLLDAVSPIQTTNRRRLPLRKLMCEEDEVSFSSSASEADSNELHGVAAGSYCVWTPSSNKKSKSMRSSSSKRWKLRDLLPLRSHSDGKKEPLLFLGPTKHASAAAKDGLGNGIARNLQPF